LSIWTKRSGMDIDDPPERSPKKATTIRDIRIVEKPKEPEIKEAPPAKEHKARGRPKKPRSNKTRTLGSKEPPRGPRMVRIDLWKGNNAIRLPKIKITGEGLLLCGTEKEYDLLIKSFRENDKNSLPRRTFRVSPETHFRPRSSLRYLWHCRQTRLSKNL